VLVLHFIGPKRGKVNATFRAGEIAIKERKQHNLEITVWSCKVKRQGKRCLYVFFVVKRDKAIIFVRRQCTWKNLPVQVFLSREA